MIKIITGAMFSGKSFELIQSVETYAQTYGLENILFFKPKLDTRDNNLIKSRATEKTYESILIENLNEIKKYINDETKLIIIDEAQFLEGNIQEILNLHYEGINFLISGLNLTSEQKPFGIMPDLLSIATEITILKSKCFFCGNPAEYTKTNDIKKDDVLIEALYYPVCKKCMEE